MTIHDMPAMQPTPLCTRYRSQLALLRTDALTPEVAARLNEHLAGCAWCRREAAAYEALDAAARRSFAGISTLPINLEDVVRAAERPATKTPGARHTGHLRPPGRPRLSAFGAVAAVLVVGVFTGLIVTRHFAGSAAGSGPIPPTPAATATVTGPIASLVGPTWRLTEFVVDGVDQPLVAGHAPTLRFDVSSGWLGGSTGCNGYSGPYALSGDILTIKGLGQTQVACGAPGVMDQERAYLDAFRRVERWRVEGDTLTLRSGDGRVQMTFRTS